MPLTLKGSSSGGVTIDVPATAGNNTLTFPAATGTALVGTTTTANQVFFGGATSGTLSQDSNLFWDNTNKRLGVGTSSPTSSITLSLNTASPPAALSGTMAHIVGADGAAPRVSVEAFAQGGQLAFRRANGTNASPSALVVNELLGTIAVFGYGATGYSGSNRGYIGFSAAENWTDSAQGTYLTFSTTATGAASASEKMRIASDGSVGIGTTSPVSKLHVSGGNIQFQNTTGAAYAYASNDSGQLYLGINNSAGTTFGGIGAYGRLIYGSGAYPLGFFTNDTLRLTLDAVGNLGLGVTPSAWVTYKALQIASTGGALSSSLSSDLELTTNAYYSSQWLSQGAGVASTRYRLYQGTHAWFTSGTSPGASGTPITFTQAMTLDANGNLGIATSGNQRLTVAGGIQLTSSAFLPSSTSPGILSYEYPITRCYVGDGTGYSWAFSKRSSSTTTDLVRISDAGDLSVSVLNSGAWSQTINSISLNNGRILCTKNDDWNMELYGTGGSRVRIFNTSNTTTVGSIQADANTARFIAGNVQLNYNGIGFPATQNPSSDANTLDDYEEGTWTPTVTGVSGTGITYTGVYTKIGRIVYCSLTIAGTSLAGTNITSTQPFSGTAYGVGNWVSGGAASSGIIQSVPFGNTAQFGGTFSAASVVNSNWIMTVAT